MRAARIQARRSGLAAGVGMILGGAGFVAESAYAEAFSPQNLAVIHVSTAFPGGGGAVEVAEYTKGGVQVGSLVQLPVSEPLGFSMSDIQNHDRHLHRSADKRFLTLTGYGVFPGSSDPAAFLAINAPRVVAVIGHDRELDISTVLTDTCDFTSIRGAVSTDGDSIWIVGDNASGATLTGGTRFTTRGSSSTVNLSQVQAFGQSRTPDNIRGVQIYNDQLYVCSGSDASVGKGVLRVGSGLPTSGAQTLANLIPGSVSISSFALMDMSGVIAGPDVLYAAAADGVRKFVLNTSGTWVLSGVYAFPAAEDVIAEAGVGGSVIVYVGGTYAIQQFTDTNPLGAPLSGATTVDGTRMLPPVGFSFGGFDFAPVASCAADFNGSGAVSVQDIFDFLASWFAGADEADFNGSGAVSVQDIFDYLAAWFAGCNA